VGVPDILAAYQEEGENDDVDKHKEQEDKQQEGQEKAGEEEPDACDSEDSDLSDAPDFASGDPPADPVLEAEQEEEEGEVYELEDLPDEIKALLPPHAAGIKESQKIEWSKWSISKLVDKASGAQYGWGANCGCRWNSTEPKRCRKAMTFCSKTPGRTTTLEQCRFLVKAWLVLGESIPEGPEACTQHLEMDLRTHPTAQTWTEETLDDQLVGIEI